MGWQVKDKLLGMAREACQTSLNDMHARTQLLIVHPSVLDDFCSYMVRLLCLLSWHTGCCLSVLAHLLLQICIASSSRQHA